MTHQKPKKRKLILSLILAFLFLLNAGLLIVFFNFSSLIKTPQVESAEYPEIQLDMKAMNFHELTLFLTKIAETKGAVYAFEVLKRAELPPSIDTHLMAHNVGTILFQQKGAQGIQYCTHDFRNACSHSIVIGLFLKEGEKAIEQLKPLCEKAPGGKGAYGMCFHGLGHGVLAYADYDMQNAVRLCEKLSTDKTKVLEARECIGGTMMEMVSGVHDPKTWALQAKTYLTQDPLSPCDSDFIPAYAKPICYTYLTPELFKRAGAALAAPTAENFQKAFPFCNLIPQDQVANRIACYGGFGKEFIVIARNKDVRNIDAMTTDEIKRVYTWCNLADTKEGSRICLDQAVGSLYWGGENNRIGAMRFCEQAPQGAGQLECFDRLTSLISYYIDDPTYKKAYCDEVPSDYQPSCKKKLL